VTVYVDDYRVRAKVGRLDARWSHLTADTEAELHEFAERLGLRRAWYQRQCKGCRPGRCYHWHYDVTDSRRTAAIRLGARAITWREMGAVVRARRPAPTTATGGTP
jgi:hypothetical protein